MKALNTLSRTNFIQNKFLPLQVSRALSTSSANIIPDQRNSVVIIGGRSQVGETLRRRYLASGWNVICTTQGKANHKLNDKGFHLEGGVDIGDESAQTKEYWNNLLKKIESKHGPIHTVVNCAGIAINDPKASYSMDDINRKPVKPMLEACIDSGVKRFTFISTQAAKYSDTRTTRSYSKSKYDAEQDIIKVMQEAKISKKDINTEATIIRPDLIISADNPGHFGSPQRMSTLPFKVTVGYDPRKAGNTILQPVSAYDVADAVINISEHNIPTPEPIDACGPEIYTVGGLLQFFKERQNRPYLFGIKVPTDALKHAAISNPRGAFERDHLDLIEHHEKNITGKIDTKEFERLVSFSREENKNTPLLTLDEIFNFTKRPVFGTHDLDIYSRTLLENIKTKDIMPLLAGAYIGLTQSRIDFNPNDKSQNNEANEGVNLGCVLLFALCAAIVTSRMRKKNSEIENPPGKHASRYINEEKEIVR